MLSKLSLISIYIMTVICAYSKEFTIVHTINIEAKKVFNFTPETKSLKIDNELSKAPIENHIIKDNKFDSQIKMLNWKLHKNLETLVFLRELESRYEKTNGMSAVINEYYDIKEEVQRSTIDITHKLSYCKSMRVKSA